MDMDKVLVDKLVKYYDSNWALHAVWGIIKIDRRILTAILLLSVMANSLRSLWPF